MTLATFKGFCKKNSESLYFRYLSNFDGQTDCVMPHITEWIRVDDYVKLFDRRIGWLVGQGRDHFVPIPNGIEVNNCVGSWQVIKI